MLPRLSSLNKEQDDSYGGELQLSELAVADEIDADTELVQPLMRSE